MNRIILFLLLFTSPLQAATVYCKSGAAGAADGSTWADAYTTLAAALTAAGAGGTVYVSENHAESQATAMSLASPGTTASPVRLLCVDDSAEPPTALATTATVTTTSTAAITFTGFCHCYGVTFIQGSGNASSTSMSLGSTTPSWWCFEKCSLQMATTGGTASIYMVPNASGIDDNLFEFINTSVKFSAVGHRLRAAGNFNWRNPDGTKAFATGSTIPTTLFADNSDAVGRAEIVGVDFSDAGSGKTIVTQASASSYPYTFIACKLGASVTTAGGSHSGCGGSVITFINCDSADTNYRYERYTYGGTETSETTIVRSTGASDGTTALGRKLVSSANVSYIAPLKTDWIQFWNETTGSNVTVTIPIITDNVTLKDGEAWLEVEYLGTSGFPIASFATDKGGDVLTPGTTNQTTDAVSSWTTTGLTTPVKQELSVTVTPQEKGLIRARVCLAKASTTMYFDPEALQTAGRSYMTQTGVTNEAAQTGGSPATTVTPYVGP